MRIYLSILLLMLAGFAQAQVTTFPSNVTVKSLTVSGGPPTIGQVLTATGTNGSLAYSNAASGGSITDGYGVTNISPLGIGLPFNPTNSGLIADGSSLMVNMFPGLTNSFPGWRRFGMISNFAVSGASITNLEERWGSNVAPAIITMKAAGLTNIYLMFEIFANDITQATSLFTNTISLWSNYVVRAQASNCHVIAFTILPQKWEFPERILNWDFGNRYIRMSTLPDYLLDWARLLPKPADTTWYTDGVHPTVLGNYRVAQALDALLRDPVHQPVDATMMLEYNTNLVFVTDGALVAQMNRNGLTVNGTTSTISGNLFIGTDLNSRIISYASLSLASAFPANSPLQIGSSIGTYYGAYGKAATFLGIDDGVLAQLSVLSTNAATVNKGARITLGGANTFNGGVTSPYDYAQIFAGKETAINTFNGYLAFLTTEPTGVFEKMRITSAGLVGIGTTNPFSRLHIEGGDLLMGGTNRIAFSNGIIFTVSSTNDVLFFLNTNGTAPRFILSDGIAGGAGLQSGGGAFLDAVTVDSNVINLATMRMRAIQLTNGAVNGYVLTSDANGLAAWAASAGGGTATNAQPPSIVLSNAALRGFLTVSNSNVGFVDSAGAYTASVPGHLTFTTDNTYDIGASGANRPRSLYVGSAITAGADITGNNVTIANGGYFQTPARANMSSPSDGVWLMQNSATTGFTRVALGGTTAAFPAIGRTNGDLIVFGGNGIFDTTPTNRLLVPGAVGIGTLAPSAKLDVPGEGRFGALIATNATVPTLNVTTVNANTLNLTNALGSNQVRLAITNLTDVSVPGRVEGDTLLWNPTMFKYTNGQSPGGFSVSGNSNQIPYLNMAGTGFLFGSTDKSAPGLGFQRNANGGSGGALLIHADLNEDIGLVQIGLPTPGSSISTFVPSLSITNRYSGDGQTTQEMVRVNFVDIDGGSSTESFIQTWRSWVSGTPPASTLVSYAAALRKDGQLMVGHGVFYPSNSLAATMPTAAQLGLGGIWTGNSNGSYVAITCINGSTTAMKVLAP